MIRAGVRGFFERWASASPAWHHRVATRGQHHDAALPVREAHALAALARCPAAGGHPRPRRHPDDQGAAAGVQRAHRGALRGRRLPPCVGNCPANVDARGQAYYLAEDRAAEAYELVRERNIDARRARPHLPPPVRDRAASATTTTSRSRSARCTAYAYERYAEVREERVKPLPRTRDQDGRDHRLRSERPDRGVRPHEARLRRHRATRRTTSPAARCTRASRRTGCRATCSSRRSTTSCAMGMDLRLDIADRRGRADRPPHRRVRRGAHRRRAAGEPHPPDPGRRRRGRRRARSSSSRDGNWKGDAGVKGKRVSRHRRRQRRRGLRARGAARRRQRGHT